MSEKPILIDENFLKSALVVINGTILLCHVPKEFPCTSAAPHPATYGPHPRPTPDNCEAKADDLPNDGKRPPTNNYGCKFGCRVS